MPVERREAPRLAAGLSLSCRLNDLTGNPLAAARVLDISPAGVALLTDRALQPGAFVLLELVNNFSGHACARGAYMRHVVPAGPGGTFALGGEFSEALTPDEFARLLA